MCIRDRSIAIALSHGAELLLLDEPTSGLDPIIRDEILDIFLDFIQNENHSIFVSTHIVEDLEKIADYITFIHKGRIILSEEKDTLLERFVILKGPKEGFAAFESSELIGYKENRFGAEAMAEAKVWRKKEAGAAGLVADPVRIQDIMLYYVKLYSFFQTYKIATNCFPFSSFFPYTKFYTSYTSLF